MVLSRSKAREIFPEARSSTYRKNYFMSLLYEQCVSKLIFHESGNIVYIIYYIIYDCVPFCAKKLSERITYVVGQLSPILYSERIRQTESFGRIRHRHWSTLDFQLVFLNYRVFRQ